MKRKYFLLLTLSLLTQPAFALFCPGNFNQINLGDTQASVIQQCGKPDTQKTVKSDASIPQEWSYYIKANPTDPASLKMTIAFVGGQVANITAQGTSLVTTQLCGGNSVSVGDKVADVKAACGEPPYVNKGQGKETESTTFIYNTSPAVIMTFEKGVLTERK